jgi:hypothetical protein
MRTGGIIFLLFSLVFQVRATQDNTSNEILVGGQPMNTEDLINRTGISLAETTLYKDVVTLTRLYAPSSILNLIDNFQNENFWELTKLTVLKLCLWVATSTEISNLKPLTIWDFDMLIVVSYAKFHKKLNGQTRFCQDGPNFVYFSIVENFLIKIFCHKIND